jgi:TusA-related sulfurtransferase
VFDSAIRWYVTIYASFHRQSDAGLQETEGGFRTQVYTATDPADIDCTAVRVELNRKVERFTNVGSGWTLTAIFRFVVRFGQYRPLVGSSFIPTPSVLIGKHELINVYNPDDNMCFVWAVLSALYPCERNADRNTKYRSHLNSTDLTGLKCPVPVNKIARFEKNNPTISINVYALGKDGQEMIPKFVTKCGARERNVDLLLFSAETDDNFHYTWIQNLSALICHRTKHESVVHVCPHCVHPFTSSRAFAEHLPDCSKHVYQVTKYPEPQSDDSIVK